MEIVVFPDTNYFLHYPQPDQTDWCKLLGADQVRLMICLGVIDELDEKKDHETLGGRASDRIKFIEQRMDSEIRPNVRIERFVFDVEKDDGGDRAIVAQIARFIKENPKVETVVLSEDYGMRNRCGTRGIRAVRPEPETRLADPLTDLKKENLSLRKQLADLRSKSPDIAVYLNGQSVQDNITLQMSLAKPSPDFAGHHHRKFNIDTAKASMSVMYRDEVAAYIKNQTTVNDESSRTIELSMMAKNVGGAPANTLTITVGWPKAKVQAACYGFLVAGARAKPAKPMQTYRLDTIMSPKNLELCDGSNVYPDKDLSDDRFVWRWHTLAHDDEIDMQRLYLTLSAWPRSRCIDLTVKVHAIDPPVSVTYPVKMILTSKTE